MNKIGGAPPTNLQYMKPGAPHKLKNQGAFDVYSGAKIMLFQPMQFICTGCQEQRQHYMEVAIVHTNKIFIHS